MYSVLVQQQGSKPLDLEFLCVIKICLHYNNTSIEQHYHQTAVCNSTLTHIKKHVKKHVFDYKSKYYKLLSLHVKFQNQLTDKLGPTFHQNPRRSYSLCNKICSL